MAPDATFGRGWQAPACAGTGKARAGGNWAGILRPGGRFIRPEAASRDEDRGASAARWSVGQACPGAPLMLVGEAPGRDEDIAGRPFVGRSGQLLDRMLAAIGMSRRENAYIANVIPWRPPGNRTPTPLETEICRPFIERQIELAKPRVLVTLGGPSAKVLLGATEGVLRLRGKWRVHTTASGVDIPTMPTLHPAYLLRNPAHKKLAWRDFLEIAAKLDG